MALPIRSVLQDQRSVAVRLGEVIGVDNNGAREVLLPMRGCDSDAQPGAAGV